MTDYEIDVAVAQSSSSTARSFGFPVLESGNLSFPNGRYIVRFQPGDDLCSFNLIHQINGAPLITNLLGKRLAKYVCAVSSPMSSYRRMHISDTPSQNISWNPDDLGEPPLFTPMIVASGDCELLLDGRRDGVHLLWQDECIRLVEGNRLALGQVIQLKSSILHLLSFHADDKLDNGTFRVNSETEQGFRFRVDIHPSLHRFLRYRSEERIREHILTHIVTACLALLQKDFREDNDDEGGWRSYRNLHALSGFLENKGLAHWADEDFRPEEIATKLYPHNIPQGEEEEDAT